MDDLKANKQLIEFNKMITSRDKLAAFFEIEVGGSINSNILDEIGKLDCGAVFCLESTSINSVWISSSSSVVGALPKILEVYKRYFKGTQDTKLKLLSPSSANYSLSKVQRLLDCDYWARVYKQKNMQLVLNNRPFINYQLTIFNDYTKRRVLVILSTARYKKYLVDSFDTEKEAINRLKDIEGGRVVVKDVIEVI